MAHNIITTIGFTCDGMTVKADGVVSDAPFVYNEAAGICVPCQDLAYACDACKSPVCVNDTHDTPKGGWFCASCYASLETCEGCGREGPDMVEVPDGWVVCDDTCWGKAEAKWRLTPEGRAITMATDISIQLDSLAYDLVLWLHPERRAVQV